MCEFCMEHGEGKKWYLQMKNYSEVLLHEELSSSQKEVMRSPTRAEWISDFWESFLIPAISAVPKKEEEKEEKPPSEEKPTDRPTEEEIVAEDKVEHFGQVLPVEDVEAVVDMVDSITRIPCGCRYILTGKEDKRYCFGFAMDHKGILGKFPDAASSLEVLEKEEAKKVLREYDEEGLVHTIWTAGTPYVVAVCNCDRDCIPYKRYIEQGRAPAFFRAECVFQIDVDLCTGCKACISQCQFGAQFYSSGLGKVYIDPGRCFGCGVCRAVCSTGAITMLPRKDVPEAADLWLRHPEPVTASGN